MDKNTCDCCEGTQVLTPANTANRPGLAALRYRVGTHARFFETMKARLSSMAVEIPDPDDPSKVQKSYPLSALTARDSNDPSIALLDSWASVADVLTFYQERIANEGFLGTASERRSVLELARLIGYALRPGVAASVFLALELDKDHDVVIQPHEVKAQSVPGPGELPQIFENDEPLDARFEWNQLQPRLSRPQSLKSILTGDQNGNVRLYVKGVNTNVKPNDVMLLAVGSHAEAFHVASVTPDADNDRTLVTFQEKYGAIAYQVADYSGVIELAKSYLEARPATGRSKPLTEMAQRVVSHLEDLVKRLQSAESDPQASQQAFDEIIARIAEERDVAVGEQYAKLAPWLNEMVEKLSAAQAGLMAEDVSFASMMVTPSTPTPAAKRGDIPIDPLKQAVVSLTKRASVPPRNTLNLDRSLGRAFGLRTDTGVRASTAFDAKLTKSLPEALANVQVTPDNPVRAYVFRALAHPFGHNAQPRAKVETGKYTEYLEWEINDPLGEQQSNSGANEINAVAARDKSQTPPHHTASLIYLDGEYKIKSNQGWVMIDSPDTSDYPLILDLANGDALATPQSMTAYGVSGKTMRINLENRKTWLNENSTFDTVRGTVVYAESEELFLADEPMEAPICDGNTDLIELDTLYSGMQSGRWVVFTGERTDVDDANQESINNIRDSEIVMLAEVIQDISNEDGQPFYYSGNEGIPLAGDKTHTWIRLAKKLEYCYSRKKTTVYGNVVKATHGETQKEILGNGDASRAFQSFTLKQSPLTYTASPIPAGTESSLNVYVNDVRWHEADTLVDLGRTDHRYILKTDDDGKTTVIFGNGKYGARPPTGQTNLRAEYRKGIGRPGNVAAEQISLLMAKPVGVQTVINPQRASGGADRESRESARKNAPLTVTALDRLVSLTDYADFARTFAGVGKAAAAMLHAGKRQLMHVTIAGVDDIPIDESSDLYRNLLLALRQFGGPDLPIVLQIRELVLLLISANLKIDPDYQWDPVVKAARAKLLETFSFERRELGQDVLLSEVIATIQALPGVTYVDVDVLGGIPEKATFDDEADRPIRRLLTPQEISQGTQSLIDDPDQPRERVPVNLSDVEEFGLIIPAQLAYLTPEVADTLVLNQVK